MICAPTLITVAATMRTMRRAWPAVAAALMAVERGARLVRVHDVKPTVDALRVWQALQSASAQN